MTNSETTISKEDFTSDEETRQLLKSILDTKLISIAVLKALRNKRGAVTDFTIAMVNKQLEISTRRDDLIGKLYSKEYPGIKKNGLFKLMSSVIETGKSQQVEYYYPHDGYDRWFSSMYVKANDGLVATNLDITARKHAEQAMVSHFSVIRQSEELALIGSWTYDLKTGALTCSDGMYRLFNIIMASEIKPELYLQYAAENSYAKAERIVKLIKEGNEPFFESLEIIVRDQVKIINVKGALVYNSEGEHVGMSGVNLDITTQVNLLEAKKELKSQTEIEARYNRKLQEVKVFTQEAERKRIAETLHNGLMQMLYGVKFSMDLLDFDKEHLDRGWLKEVKKNTERLLAETISESRRISHELTPAVLEEMGLKAAMQNICEQFSKSFRLDCRFFGLNKKLSKYIETTIYRTTQELLMNIIKHAQATEASVKVHVNKRSVVLTVKDNGIGFRKNQKTDGIGLKTIQNKLKLLNGRFTILANDGKENIIIVRIPI